MWIYDQRTGEFGASETGAFFVPICHGYSGFGGGKNNPEMQNVRDVGPIPEGVYTIGPAFADPEKGPVVMALTPDVDNEMFGRAGFLIHGDSIEHPGEASQGCIILDKLSREQVAESTDRTLKVI